MDMETLLRYAPRAIVALIGVGVVLELRKYKRNNDAAAWMRSLYGKADKASKDEAFRQAELADATAQLASLPAQTPVTPLSNKQLMRVAMFPRLLYVTGFIGAAGVYIGLFEGVPAGVPLPLYLGWAFLALTLLLYAFTEKGKKQYRRAQQLNRKYLLEKAGGDPARFATLKEVLEYYPTITDLWVELADQYGVEKRYDEAVAAVRKARELAPGKIDFAIVEISFLLRQKDAGAAAKALDEAEKLEKSPSDPRISIYRGMLAVERNEKKTALRYGKEALELDADFTEQLVKNDSGLEKLAELWEELFREREKTLFSEVAARQETRIAEEKKENPTGK
jgi:tetratricopeptide (TPR) repeat protein